MMRFNCAVDGESDYFEVPDDVGAVLNLMELGFLVGINMVAENECYIDVYPKGTSGRIRERSLLYMAPVYTKEQAVQKLIDWVREGCNVQRDEG